jgi:hypothetical protein
VLRAHNRKLTLRLSIAMLSISIVGIVGAFVAKPVLSFMTEIFPFLLQFY